MHSAHVVLGAGAMSLRSGSTWTQIYCAYGQVHPHPYLARVVDDAYQSQAVLVVEDVPQIKGRFDTVTKTVCRLQGRVETMCRERGIPMVYVMPAKWQRAMGVWQTTPKAQEELAAVYGLVPPDMLARFEAMGKMPASGPERSAARALAKKIRTDFVSAYLIGVWAQGEIADKGSVSAAFSQPLTSIA